MFSLLIFACTTTGSVIVEKQPVDTATVDDTGVSADTNTEEETDDTEIDDPSDEDTEDTEDTTDPEDTSDTDEQEIPEDNNNPSIDLNYWDGFWDITYNGCTERITETGFEVTSDYPNWLALCDCDEIYFVETDVVEACGVSIPTQQFFRGIKYNGNELEIRWYPGVPTTPTESTFLATASVNSDLESWSYDFQVDFESGSAFIDGGVSFTE